MDIKLFSYTITSFLKLVLKTVSSILCQDKARDFMLISMGMVYFIFTSKNQNILFHIFHIFAAKLKHAAGEKN